MFFFGGCINCITPRNCVNFDAEKCGDCVKYNEKAECIGKPILPNYACFTCKHNDTCVAASD